ncbi:MAG TPA: response regulator transcription factor [Acidimicrobiia bacterium]|jgi:DNA-binding NarL/FixJ family response regulator
MTRVLLADDHQLLRQALRRALEDSGYDVVAEAGDGEEAMHGVAEHRPDLVVIDVTMPVLDGVEATRRIHSQWPDISIVVLTMHAEDALKAEALRAGAAAFLTKDSAMHELVATVDAVTRGETMSADVAAQIVREFEPLAGVAASHAHAAHNGNGHAPAHTNGKGDGSPLTPREEEILQLIADGRSTTEAARELFISAKTVKNHLASIYAKLDARDRTQAVLYAVRSGIVRLD